MIIGRAERLQIEIYPESGCVRSYSYQTEISNSWYAKCLCNEELFSRNVAWAFQVKHTLTRETPLLIWLIHSVFLNFRFEINMATPYNTFQNTRKSRNDFFLVHSAHLTLTWKMHTQKKQIRQLKKKLCSSKFTNLVLTEIIITQSYVQNRQLKAWF